MDSSKTHGVQAIELGLQIARCLASGPGAMPLKDIASASCIAPAKVHRYLASLIRGGLVEQDRVTGLYSLGQLAVELGLVALERLDLVELATNPLRKLSQELNETVLLTVWGNQGPTVIRWFESAQPVFVNIRLGSVLPLLASASGRCFLTYLPWASTKSLAQKEFADPTVPFKDKEDLQSLIEQVRRDGLARGQLMQGMVGLGAPVFNQQSGIEAVIGALGSEAIFDASTSGRISTLLRQSAAELSRRLGYRGAPLSPSSSSPKLHER